MEEAVRDEAKKEKISLNKAVIRLLEKALGRSRFDEPQELYHDLDRFCRTWTAEQASEFDENLEQTRVVDEELWK